MRIQESSCYSSAPLSHIYKYLYVVELLLSVIVGLYVYIGWMLDANSRPDFSALSIDFNKFCMDPLRYISTLVDGQVEDYSELPVNDASIVDKHVYETPLNYTVDASDGSELPLAYTEPGDYDNPDNVPVSPMEQSQPGEYDNTTFVSLHELYCISHIETL